MSTTARHTPSAQRVRVIAVRDTTAQLRRASHVVASFAAGVATLLAVWLQCERLPPMCAPGTAAVCICTDAGCAWYCAVKPAGRP